MYHKPLPRSTPSRRQQEGGLIKVVAYNDLGKAVGSDQSDSTFTIEVVDVTSPKEGETLISGTQPTISWQTNGTNSIVKDATLYYTKNGGTTWIPIGIDSTNSGNYNTWTVPYTASVLSKCKVKVVLRNKNGATVGSGLSDGYFTISPP